MAGQDFEAHRDVLMRYALVHLRDAAAAEDAVQDTLLAALQAGAEFRGQSAPRTWLIGILKRKVIDRFRAGRLETSAADAGLEGDGADDGGLMSRLFDQSGHWVVGPRPWGNPDAEFEREGFWTAFELCVGNLPPKAARVFVMRELIGLDPEEVCKESGISPSNYWVTMHRARLRLRDCLERRWFGRDPEAGTA